MGPQPGPVLPREKCQEVSSTLAHAAVHWCKIWLCTRTQRLLPPADVSFPHASFACREFANGFLFAEVLSRYYPSDVHMHSFENVSSTERKKSNWGLLTKLLKVCSDQMSLPYLFIHHFVRHAHAHLQKARTFMH